MLIFIGYAIILISILICNYMMGGVLHIAIQISELVVIIGSSIGIFISSGNSNILYVTLSNIAQVILLKSNSKKDYIKLLKGMNNQLEKISYSENIVDIENDIENNKITFCKDSISANAVYNTVKIFINTEKENYKQVHESLKNYIDTYEKQLEKCSDSVFSIVESLPALGIIGCIFGLIKSMKNIDSPESVALLIASSLGGTMMGLILAYCFLFPLGCKLIHLHKEKVEYLRCIENIFKTYLESSSIINSIECGRNIIPAEKRPLLKEIQNNEE